MAGSTKDNTVRLVHTTKRLPSIWQLTIAERNNAATFIAYTTVRPFTFMGCTFKCFFCNQYHSVYSDLLEHTLTHQIEPKDAILKKYVRKGKRALHVDISKLECRLCHECDETFKDLNIIKEHLIHSHGIKFYPANNGLTEFKMELVNNMFVCHLCGDEFHTFLLLKGHMNRHVARTICEECGAGFTTNYYLIVHKETHLALKFNCKFCDKVFSKNNQLKYHVKKIHRNKIEKPKKCQICLQIFKQHHAWNTHLRKAHGIMKNYDCHICNTKFVTRRALTEHTNRYHLQKFKCEVCFKCFITEYRLKHHMRGHTGERNFVCHICKNAYMHVKGLKNHMKRHHDLLKQEEDFFVIDELEVETTQLDTGFASKE